jgi:hypothetical protein
MIFYQLNTAPYMPNSASSNPRLSSTASPLPTVPKGAGFPLSAGSARRIQIIDIARLFGPEGAIFGAETGFSAVDRGSSNHALSAQHGDLGRVVAEGPEDLVGVLAEERRAPPVGSGVSESSIGVGASGTRGLAPVPGSPRRRSLREQALSGTVPRLGHTRIQDDFKFKSFWED